MPENSAVISPCGHYRYRLDRWIQPEGLVYAYFGVNASTATATQEDQTTRKWAGFTKRNGGKRYIVGNPFAYRATDVRELSRVDDPVGIRNEHYLVRIINEADVLVPCWGNRTKVPRRLRHHFTSLWWRIKLAGKPIRVFGFTQSGEPMHPLMLGYNTPMISVTIDTTLGESDA